MKLLLGYHAISQKQLYTFKTTSNAIVPVPLIRLNCVSEISSVLNFQKSISKTEMMWTVFWNQSHLEKLQMGTNRMINEMVCHWSQWLKISPLQQQKLELLKNGSLASLIVNHHRLVLYNCLTNQSVHFDVNGKITSNIHGSTESCEAVPIHTTMAITAMKNL